MLTQAENRIRVAHGEPRPTPHGDRETYRLCYVDGCWAWFVPRDPTAMWGDDWNDRPYEHNAGSPYLYEWLDDEATASECGRYLRVPRREVPCVIVAWDGDLVPACDGHLNSPWSVQDINRGDVPWLRSSEWGDGQVRIRAGVTLAEFRRLVAEAGGIVYERAEG